VFNATQLKAQLPVYRSAPDFDAKYSADDILGNLDITLKGAKDLIAADPFPYSSDPYVLFRMGDALVRSDTIMNNLNPKWNQDLSLPIVSFEDDLIIRVMDYDPAEQNDGNEDDFLGEIKIRVTDFSPNELLDLNIPLQGVASGSLQLKAIARASFKSTGGAKRYTGDIINKPPPPPTSPAPGFDGSDSDDESATENNALYDTVADFDVLKDILFAGGADDGLDESEWEERRSSKQLPRKLSKLSFAEIHGSPDGKISVDEFRQFYSQKIMH
jgi:hypothetical protein